MSTAGHAEAAGAARLDGALLDRLGRVCLVGCGNMGGAMLRRWIATGLPAAQVTVVDPGSPALPGGVRLIPRVTQAGAGIDTLVLAVKPQQLDALLAGGDFRDAAPGLAISILAGVEAAVIGRSVAGGAVVRAMPNLPVGIGQGVTALHASRDRSDASRLDDAAALMATLGHVEWIDDEALFDAVTALSGCGPGFTFRFVDALAAAGEALGLPAGQAARLARATVAGAGAMAAASDETPARLADRVASPGGSTRAGLDVLDRDQALRRLLAETLAAAARRNAEMAAAAR